MLLAINRQLDTLRASAAQVAPAQASQGVAGGAEPAGRSTPGAAGEAESLVDIAVGLFDALKAAVARWQESVTDWESADWVNEARRGEAAYRKLQIAFTDLHRGLVRLCADGQAIGNLDKFNRARLELDALCQLSVDRMLKTDQDLREGRGRSTAEVRDELRRRLGA